MGEIPVRALQEKTLIMFFMAIGSLIPLKERIRKIGYSGMHFAHVKIGIAKLGDKAGIYGAFVLAKQIERIV